MAEEKQEPETKYFAARYLDPKFPIVKSEPTVDHVIKSLRTSDYLFMSGSTAGSWVYGYILGKPVRGPTAAMCASVGFTFGMMFTMQTVRNRLLGILENEKEVKKWGLAPVQPRGVHQITERRFPSRQPMSSPEVVPKLNWDKYD
mmetsp:Transcript_779/g.1861  ORF Transcript_779/g.1861 Transcript_779/m.1861 type:complete len:145 (+) Transcript_779:93-527(+)|eukprot:CAMPEP_0119551660 /NCGR_PEP_ID=MMETSP1352-20130426/4849_1 /TAXON_ID=265584 /ORGANISM="Stauroneis constricta, Strain CCMP1120" /LENGTH=144 /DNA_ID=CAMNT_0007597753 /DNA_START=51 /DNA_END=485 /DNA_ORIENTATION=+